MLAVEELLEFAVTLTEPLPTLIEVDRPDGVAPDWVPMNAWSVRPMVEDASAPTPPTPLTLTTVVVAVAFAVDLADTFNCAAVSNTPSPTEADVLPSTSALAISTLTAKMPKAPPGALAVTVGAAVAVTFTVPLLAVMVEPVPINAWVVVLSVHSASEPLAATPMLNDSAVDIASPKTFSLDEATTSMSPPDVTEALVMHAVTVSPIELLLSERAIDAPKTPTPSAVVPIAALIIGLSLAETWTVAPAWTVLPPWMQALMLLLVVLLAVPPAPDAARPMLIDAEIAAAIASA